MNSFYEVEEDRLTLRIFAQPKSAKTSWGEVVTRDGGRWIQLKISSPPVDGAANKEAIKYLSKAFKTAKSNIRMIQGDKSRYKVLELVGWDRSRLETFLQEYSPARK